MILTEALTIILDVSATAADMYFKYLPLYFVNLLNTLYFIAFFTRAYVLYRFAASVMKDLLRKNAIVRELLRIPLYLGLIFSLFSIFGSESLHYFIFYVDEAGYHQGSAYFLLYVSGFFYVILSFISSYLFRKSFGRMREKYSMLLYNTLIFASLVVRFVLPKHLLLDTFVLMAILVVYLAFINPEYFLDLRGMTFNSIAFRELIEENLDNMKFVPVGVVIQDYREMTEIYGSPQMEEGLTLIARYLKNVFHTGTVFYFGGGRFVIHTRPDQQIGPIKDRIMERFNRPWKSYMVELYLHVGFVEFVADDKGRSASTLINSMFEGLDAAGSSDNGREIRVTDIELERIEKGKEIRKSLDAALEGDGFELFLQPIVDAATGKLRGAEALSRIKDAEGDIIYPKDFIPIAESNGRINKLGEKVFETACSFIKEGYLEKTGMSWINVNLSPAQFVRLDLAERFAAIAEKYGVDPEKVHLEITEGTMIDEAFLAKQVNAMGKKGFKFVLDDYGTGYSNLSRLRKVPFINVKLDMSIVWDYCKEPDEILPNMIQTFKNMRFTVTGEGIEDAQMSKFMTDIGCDLLQGYHYSMPLPASDFVRKYSV